MKILHKIRKKNNFWKLKKNIKDILYNYLVRRSGFLKKVLKKFLIAVLFIILILFLNLIFTKDENKTYAASSSSTSDLQLMARAINGEARGEPYEGQVAVGAVILNRVKNSSFPNTIAGVIYEPGAFTAVSDGQINVAIAENSTVYKAAQDALNGWDPTGGAIYYFNPNTATNKWIWSRPFIKQIGKHRFCK